MISRRSGFAPGASNSDQYHLFPRPSIVEVWGESPLFPGPSWRLSWTLNQRQLMAVSTASADPGFWSSIQDLTPALADLCCPWRGAFKPTASLSETLPLEIIVDLAQSLLAPAQLSQCNIKPEAGLEAALVVLTSLQHDLAGVSIHLAAELIRAGLESRLGRLPFGFHAGLSASIENLLKNVRTCCKHDLTMALLAEAARRQIPIFLVDADERLYQFGAGSYGRLLSSSANDFDSHLGVMFARNKSRARAFLMRLGLPVPREVQIQPEMSDRQLIYLANKIGFPCVVKPQGAERGRGVTTNIRDEEGLLLALKQARGRGNAVILLQSHVEGSDYRLNVIRGRLDSVIKRSPPVVVGNGVDTIRALIDDANAIRRSLRSIDGVSTEIDCGSHDVLFRLSKAGFHLDSIPELGQVVELRGNANIATGGVREEIAVDDVHPRIRRQCESIACSLRLDVCGIDYLASDISADPLRQPGAYIEVNSMPQTSPRRAELLVDNLFRDLADVTMPCFVLLSDWSQEAARALEKLYELVDLHPLAIIACPRELKEKIWPLLDAEILQRIHVFAHPRELLLDKTIQGLVCLMTPQILMSRGLPVSGRRSRIVVCSAFLSAPLDAWSDYLAQYSDDM